MRIGKELKELDEEIAELHNYTQMQRSMTLNKIAAVLLPPSLLTGFFGMNVISFPSNDKWMAIGAVVSIILSAVVGYFAVNNFSTLKKSLKASFKYSKVKSILIGLFILAVLLGMCYFACISPEHSTISVKCDQCTQCALCANPDKKDENEFAK